MRVTRKGLWKLWVQDLALTSLLATTSVAIADDNGSSAIPHLDAAGRQEYAQYQSASPHRAFVIAPGGAWAWSAEESSPRRALDIALETCAEHTQQQCIAYAENEKVVFDADAWPRLWGPYPSREEAGQSSVGVHRWQRFPNLQFQSAEGSQRSISDWRGKLLILHFWGTWCAYCLPELKGLQALKKELAEVPEIAFVLLQVREPFAVTRKWVQDEGLSLPLYDSGSHGEEDDMLHLADGSTIRDRELARLFPTTYVLDRHGTVLYSRTGPAPDWSEYAPFLRHAAANSGS